MVSAPIIHRYSYAEYLELERSSDLKHELIDGEIVAMAGGTPRHARIIANVAQALGNALAGGKCISFSSDLKVRSVGDTFAAYPDASVFCGPLERASDDRNALTNPTVVIEVLSPSTERYDRGPKFLHYQRIPTLQHYLLVAHEEPLVVEHFQRAGNTWIYTVHPRGDSVTLAAVGVTLHVDDLFRDVPED